MYRTCATYITNTFTTPNVIYSVSCRAMYITKFSIAANDIIVPSNRLTIPPPDIASFWLCSASIISTALAATLAIKSTSSTDFIVVAAVAAVAAASVDFMGTAAGVSVNDGNDGVLPRDVLIVVAWRTGDGNELVLSRVSAPPPPPPPTSMGECGEAAPPPPITGLPSYALIARYHNNCCSLDMQHISHLRLACTIGS